jgi:hypothetical protein
LLTDMCESGWNQSTTEETGQKKEPVCVGNKF